MSADKHTYKIEVTVSDEFYNRSLLKENDRYHFALTDIRGLVDALETVCWDLSQETIPEGNLDTLRSAVIGISAALDSRVKAAEGAH